ncbi:MAG: flagellin [Alphaproteobacteria bacterium]
MIDFVSVNTGQGLLESSTGLESLIAQTQEKIASGVRFTSYLDGGDSYRQMREAGREVVNLEINKDNAERSHALVSSASDALGQIDALIREVKTMAQNAQMIPSMKPTLDLKIAELSSKIDRIISGSTVDGNNLLNVGNKVWVESDPVWIDYTGTDWKIENNEIGHYQALGNEWESYDGSLFQIENGEIGSYGASETVFTEYTGEDWVLQDGQIGQWVEFSEEGTGSTSNNGNGHCNGNGHGEHGNGHGEHGNGHVEHGNGHGEHGNGHGEHGNGHGEHGNGHVEHGNGHGEHGNGHGEHGNGHVEHGNGHGEHGNGHGAHGNGHGEHGNGHVEHGNGHGVHGNGHGEHGNGHGHDKHGCTEHVHNEGGEIWVMYDGADGQSLIAENGKIGSYETVVGAWDPYANSDGNGWVIEDGEIGHYTTSSTEWVPYAGDDLKIEYNKISYKLTEEGGGFQYKDADPLAMKLSKDNYIDIGRYNITSSALGLDQLDFSAGKIEDSLNLLGRVSDKLRVVRLRLDSSAEVLKARTGLASASINEIADFTTKISQIDYTKEQAFLLSLQTRHQLISQTASFLDVVKQIDLFPEELFFRAY